MTNDNTLITSIDLSKGQRLTVDGNVCRVDRVVDDQVTIENEVSRRMTVMSQTDLIQRWMDGTVTFILDDDKIEKLGAANDNLGRSFDSFPEELQERARRARRYALEAIEAMPDRLSDRRLEEVIAKVAEKESDGSPPSPRSVRRWVSAWRISGGDIRALVPCHSAKGNHDPQIPSVIVRMIEEAIDTAYMRRERITIATVASEVLKSLDEYNRDRLPNERLELPSNETLYRAIRRRDPYAVMVARHGKKAADDYFKPVFSVPRAEYPLHVVQVDHTRVNVFAHVRGRAVLKRAWLTSALDQCTRMIVGLHIGFDAPGYLTVMLLIRNMVLPKSYVRQRFKGIDADWPCFGLPKILLVDNGKEFHSQAFRDACFQLGIEVRYCEAGHPQQKASIERVFRTFNDQLIHQLPGTSFENPVKRGDYDSRGRATVDFDVLVEALHHYIIDLYHRSYHRGLRDTPLEAWLKATKTNPVSLPPSVQSLTILTAKVVSRPIHHYGIEINRLRYNSYELARLRPRKGDKKRFTVRYDPTDLSKIWVLDDEVGNFIPVPSTELDYTEGLSEYQHLVVVRHARKANGGSKVSRETLLRTRSKILAKITAAEAKGKANTVNAVRFAGTKTNSPHVDIRETQRATPPSPEGFDDLFGDGIGVEDVLDVDDDDADLVDDDLDVDDGDDVAPSDNDLTERPSPIAQLDNSVEDDDVDLDAWGSRFDM